jgi:hypothetical protein
MKAQKFKKEMLNDFSEILSTNKLKYLECCIDNIINAVKLDIIMDRYKDYEPTILDSSVNNEMKI